MYTRLNYKLADAYKSASQKIRVMTEAWVREHAFCPSCGKGIKSYEDNRPVADFFCRKCQEDYELKSKKNAIGNMIVDGAYDSMIGRLREDNSPSFFLLTYKQPHLEVTNLMVIPKHFFSQVVIEPRKALSPSARRAGWIGCNILMKYIPNSGRIFYVREGRVQPKRSVLNKWKQTLFLRDSKLIKSRGWMVDVMRCADNFGNKEFTLQQMYGFENSLSERHPNNKHIRDKIRQQMQLLRDRGYLEFLGRGRYRLVNHSQNK